jgi:hypothetical protein
MLERCAASITTHTPLLISIAGRHSGISSLLLRQLVLTLLYSRITYVAPFIVNPPVACLKPLTINIAKPVKRMLHLPHNASSAKVLQDINLPSVAHWIRYHRYAFLHRTLNSAQDDNPVHAITDADRQRYHPQLVHVSRAKRYESLWSIMMRELPPGVEPPAQHVPVTKRCRRALLGLQRPEPPHFYSMSSSPSLFLFFRIRFMCALFNARLSHFSHQQVDPSCTHCGQRETDEHVLLHCPRYTTARHRLLSTLDSYNIILSINLLTAFPWPLPAHQTKLLMSPLLQYFDAVRRLRPYQPNRRVVCYVEDSNTDIFDDIDIPLEDE